MTQSVVHFHIFGGGRKEFKGVEDMTFDESCVTIINTDDNGNPLPDNEWTLIDDSSERILLQGKTGIMSRTGRIDYDGQYDTDVFKFVEDCTDEEIALLQQAIENNSIEAMNLALDDIEYINQWH